jgi:hypothetical protein
MIEALREIPREFIEATLPELTENLGRGASLR